MDPLTETVTFNWEYSIEKNGLIWIQYISQYGLTFYMQYLAHWPEYFQLTEAPGGEIMGYSIYIKLHIYEFILIFKNLI